MLHHFLIEITYTAPMEAIGAAVGEHREYLQLGYDQGLLLCSGPQVPKTGGLVMARCLREAVESFFAEDPYRKQGLADYRIVEFEPVKYQSLLEEWITRPNVTP